VTSVPDTLRELLLDYRLNIPYEDLERDMGFIRGRGARSWSASRASGIDPDDVRLQVLTNHFYRNKGAYIVGRILSGQDSMPFVLPILHNERGAVYVDTVLFGSDRVSVVFSFTRSYFMVDATIPSQYVLFLAKLMPAKPISEIYNCMGFNKHGKTYYHRSAVRHMEATTDKFIIAPGHQGHGDERFHAAVLSVRVQGDQGSLYAAEGGDPGGGHGQVPPGETRRPRRAHGGHAGVHQPGLCPRPLLGRTDRGAVHGGALADQRARQGADHRSPVRRTAHDAAQSVSAGREDDDLLEVMDEYGNAIKQLAAANIFPGDMLLKNFGVTRHGRVVFYDYDEIVPLLDCNFRRIPPPRDEMEEMASQPWYSVGPNDIFPEEFRLFFSGNQRARKAFDERHSDLYDAGFWKALQERIRSGHVESFYPYRRTAAFPA
jgi:isocitrate dehydrogenase kinase/phosphatase